MKFSSLRNIFPSAANALLALLSAILLILSFPDFDFWFLAYIALVPLFLAIAREKQFWRKSFFLGWIFGTVFFFGTCWWLTFAPITYAGFPAWLAYTLMFFVTLVVGFFPAIFSALFSILLKRFGDYAVLSAPFLWTAAEFLRFSVTGNNWNAIGYSQAFYITDSMIRAITVGGIHLAGFQILLFNTFVFSASFLIYENLWENKTKASLKNKIINYSLLAYFFPLISIILPALDKNLRKLYRRKKLWRKFRFEILAPVLFFFFLSISVYFLGGANEISDNSFVKNNPSAFVVAVQPNVPMSGIKYDDWMRLRERHVQLAENALDANLSKIVEEKKRLYSNPETFEEYKKDLFTESTKKQIQEKPKIIIFPESPMIFMFSEDVEFREFLTQFASKNNASVLFNAAEPDAQSKRNFNSAVMVNPLGEKIAQYDKIHLLPFGEFQPLPDFLASEIPAFVGSFSFGSEYDLIPFGDASGGVMICFESHFGVLSREYAARGADFLIEMTNDGYLGKTGVLRQHLANSVFRAVETNRPLLRVTNVGITAFINERGEVSDAADVYTEAARVWTVSKSDGKQTFYVKYGDWFAWLCSFVSLALLFWSYFYKKRLVHTDNL